MSVILLKNLNFLLFKNFYKPKSTSFSFTPFTSIAPLSPPMSAQAAAVLTVTAAAVIGGCQSKCSDVGVSAVVLTAVNAKPCPIFAAATVN